jgi:hypothetical protein
LAGVSRAAFADRRRLGFNPVIDGTLFPGGPFAPDAPLSSINVPLMIGSNKDEMTLFLGHMPWVTDATFEGRTPTSLDALLSARGRPRSSPPIAGHSRNSGPMRSPSPSSPTWAFARRRS